MKKFLIVFFIFVTSVNSYGWNFKKFIQKLDPFKFEKRSEEIFHPPRRDEPRHETQHEPRHETQHNQGFWQGPDNRGGCNPIEQAQNFQENMNTNLGDMIEFDPGADFLDLIFDWDRAHKRYGKVKFELNVWKKEEFDINNCQRYLEEFKADMNQLNRMENAELIAAGAGSFAGPVMVAGVAVALPALAVGAVVVFKKWTIEKSAKKHEEKHEECLEMQKKALEDLQERAREKARIIEEKMKNKEKVEIEDIEI